MNLRKKSARIQPTAAIMVKSSSRRSIPASVEFIRVGERPLHQEVEPRELQDQQSSQPIPIQKRGSTPQDIEDEVHSADSTSHYDWATWRMYERITTARRVRASRGGHSRNHQQERSVGMAVSQELNDIHAFAAPNQVFMSTLEPVMAHAHHSQQQSMDDFDGVFLLE